MSPYLLIVLSTGRTTYLERTLAAIDEHLRPRHAELFIFDDSVTRLGQCAAYGRLWEYAAQSDYERVVVFEEDYVCLQPIDVAHMAALMDSQPHLLQLTLMRQAWLAEIPYGSYVARDPGWYERRTEGSYEWIETTRNWANAPTLFRTSLAQEFEWPNHPGCETEIGPIMLEKYPESRFGIYGLGGSQVAHIGVERAPGSHGY